MIFTGGTQFFFTKGSLRTGFQTLKHGDIVTAKILSLKSDGLSRIFFNGSVFKGSISGSLKEGDVLKMRAVVDGERIFLVPQNDGAKPAAPESIFSKIGLVKTELAAAILRFFTAAETRLDKISINRVLQFLNKSEKDKKKAAFAAFLLENKGVTLSKELFEKVCAAVFGDEDGGADKNDGHSGKQSGGKQFGSGLSDNQSGSKHSNTENPVYGQTESPSFPSELSLNKCFENKEKQEPLFNGKEPLQFAVSAEQARLFDRQADADSFYDENAELFEALNHLRGEGLQWIVLPFKKTLKTDVQKTVSGSLALLLNLHLKTCKTAVLRCKTGGESWIFSLKDKILTFTCEDLVLPKKKVRALQKILFVCLLENNVTDLTVKYGEPFLEEEDFFSLDVSV